MLIILENHFDKELQTTDICHQNIRIKITKIGRLIFKPLFSPREQIFYQMSQNVVALGCRMAIKSTQY